MTNVTNLVNIKPAPTEESLPTNNVEMVSSIFDIPISQFQSSLDRRIANRNVILKWIKQNLSEGVDYGIVPTKRGTPKKSLFKAGAEKILVMLGITVTFPSFSDYEQVALNNQPPLEQIIIRCELLFNNIIVSSGIGARNVKQDFGDINKSLKMASKSAMILATLTLGLSEIFTLDIGDEPTDDKTTVDVIPTISHDNQILIEEKLDQFNIDKTRFETWVFKLVQTRQYPPISSLSEIPEPLLVTVLDKIESLKPST